ncbi:MAG: hypothetical protein EON93_01385 [Burkholderiales bacterium]|nr:MAG: hypothetical protein EON93_01385 [Burkholderiales bacterium]
MPNSKFSVTAKLLVALVALTALAGVAGAQLAPTVPVSTVLLYSAVGAVALFAVVVIWAVIGLTFRQFILRNGGTDTQWFWFSGEPKGLEQLRGKGSRTNASQGTERGF